MADHSATGDRARQLGATIRRLRTERGWTQAHLGEAAGLDRQTVLRVERALYSPVLYRLFRLADALGVHPAVLFLAAGETVQPAAPAAYVMSDGELLAVAEAAGGGARWLS